MCATEARRSTWHWLSPAVFGVHIRILKQKAVFCTKPRLSIVDRSVALTAIKGNAVCRVLNTLGCACQESQRRAGPSMQISCQLLRMELTDWTVEDVTCMFMILNKAFVREPQGSAFHIISVSATLLEFACICSIFGCLKGHLSFSRGHLWEGCFYTLHKPVKRGL
jgi:hypothetical protein